MRTKNVEVVKDRWTDELALEIISLKLYTKTL